MQLSGGVGDAKVMETVMSLQSPNTAPQARLRLVFSNAVKSFDLVPHATLGDIALKMRDPALRGLGKPLAVDVAWIQ